MDGDGLDAVLDRLVEDAPDDVVVERDPEVLAIEVAGGIEIDAVGVEVGRRRLDRLEGPVREGLDGLVEDNALGGSSRNRRPFAVAAMPSLRKSTMGSE